MCHHKLTFVSQTRSVYSDNCDVHKILVSTKKSLFTFIHFYLAVTFTTKKLGKKFLIKISYLQKHY